MAEQKSGSVTMTVEELRTLLAGKPHDPTDLEATFLSVDKLRDAASKKVKPHQYRAFVSPTRAIGVAYVVQSAEHAGGRVIKFDAYEAPPWEQQRDLQNAEPETVDNGKGLATPNVRYQQWRYQTFALADLRAYIGGDAEKLPGGSPRRATLADALEDLPKLREERDAEYLRLCAAKNGVTRAGPLPAAVALPAVEPLKKAG